MQIAPLFEGSSGTKSKTIMYLRLTQIQLFEGLFNPKINFTPWEWKKFVENELDGVSYEGRMMRCLSRIPDIMARGRKTLKGNTKHQKLVDDVSDLYKELKVILAELHDRFEAVDELVNANGAPKTATLRQIHCHYQRTYGLALSICVIANCVHAAIDKENTQLIPDSLHFSKEIIAVADGAAIYRPLGASYVELCLVAAWIGAEDGLMRAEVEKSLADYQLDFANEESNKVPVGHLEQLSRQLRLLDPDFD